MTDQHLRGYRARSVRILPEDRDAAWAESVTRWDEPLPPHRIANVRAAGVAMRFVLRTLLALGAFIALCYGVAAVWGD